MATQLIAPVCLIASAADECYSAPPIPTSGKNKHMSYAQWVAIACGSKRQRITTSTGCLLPVTPALAMGDLIPCTGRRPATSVNR